MPGPERQYQFKMKPLTLLLILVFFQNFSASSPKSESGNTVSKNKYHLADPFRFVISEFKNHDIIFLGEPHKIKENLLFLAELMPEMHKNGINILFYEFASFDDSIRINRLISSESFDEAVAEDIMQSVYPGWNYREYAGIFRSAWKINRNCKKNQKKFKIIGLNNADRLNESYQKWTEENWADCIYRKAVINQAKALVYCGAQHALTKYQKPLVIDGSFSRMANKSSVGQHLYRMIGNRCITVWFHHMWPDRFNDYRLLPCQGSLDSIILSLPEAGQHFAFDTGVSPLGLLKDTASFYSMGYHQVQLQQITDGYIVLKPISKLTSITELIPDSFP